MLTGCFWWTWKEMGQEIVLSSCFTIKNIGYLAGHQNILDLSLPGLGLNCLPLKDLQNLSRRLSTNTTGTWI